MFKRVLKIIAISFLGLLLLGVLAFGGVYYYFIGRFDEDLKTYPHPIGHIDTSTALLNDVYDLCDTEALYNLHSPRHELSFEGSKATFRESVEKELDSTISDDSGYVNFRFLVTCKGEPGWFEIRKTDLAFEKASLDEKMVSSLLDFTARPEHWAVIDYGSGSVDYYMYVTYRLEHGKVTEILP